MEDKNFSVIKPVESLNNIAGLNSAQDRRKRKKDRRQSQDDDQKQQKNEEPGSRFIEMEITQKVDTNDGEEHTIDYRA